MTIVQLILEDRIVQLLIFLGLGMFLQEMKHVWTPRILRFLGMGEMAIGMSPNPPPPHLDTNPPRSRYLPYKSRHLAPTAPHVPQVDQNPEFMGKYLKLARDLGLYPSPPVQQNPPSMPPSLKLNPRFPTPQMESYPPTPPPPPLTPPRTPNALPVPDQNPPQFMGKYLELARDLGLYPSPPVQQNPPPLSPSLKLNFRFPTPPLTPPQTPNALPVPDSNPQQLMGPYLKLAKELGLYSPPPVQPNPFPPAPSGELMPPTPPLTPPPMELNTQFPFGSNLANPPPPNKITGIELVLMATRLLRNMTPETLQGYFDEARFSIKLCLDHFQLEGFRITDKIFAKPHLRVEVKAIANCNAWAEQFNSGLRSMTGAGVYTKLYGNRTEASPQLEYNFIIIDNETVIVSPRPLEGLNQLYGTALLQLTNSPAEEFVTKFENLWEASFETQPVSRTRRSLTIRVENGRDASGEIIYERMSRV